MANSFSVVTDFKTTLSSSMTATQTTLPLTSLTTVDGHALTMADLGAEVYFVISPGASDMEIIKATGLTASPPTGTGLTRGLAFYGTSETAVAANKKAHSAGSVVIITNAHYVYERFVDKEGDETIGGNKTFTGKETFPGDNPTRPTLTSDVDTVTTTDLLTFGQLQRTAIAGGTPATELALGLVKLSSASGTPAQPVVLNNDEVSATPGANKVVKADGAGKLPAGWGGAASSLATLDGSLKVVQNPASASATPAINTIPISPGGSAVLADGFQTVSAANAATLTGGVASNADALHTHTFNKAVTVVYTDVNIASSAAETTLFTVSVPGGTLGTGGVMQGRMKVSGFSLINAQNIVFKLKYGATTMVTSTIANVSGGTIALNGGFIDFAVFAQGATNAQEAYMVTNISDSGIVNGAGGASFLPSAFATDMGTAAEDSTAAKTLTITAQFSSSSASNTFNMDNCMVEIIH